MSIIIKGMDMPKKDTGCRIIILYDGQVAMDDGTFIPEYKAIEIPTPHGRLIDTDNLKKHTWDDGYDLYVYWQYINNAPTILEAEE